MVNQNVETGEHIANVGNGENLFPYHLHFDISQTDILLNSPGHWPGHTRQLVRIHYVNPKEWLQAHITSVDGVVNPPPPTTQEWYVVAPIGLRVRKDHSTSALQVDALPFGSRVSIEDSSTVDQDSYTWGKISGGMHDGNWMAMGKADKSETYLSKYP